MTDPRYEKYVRFVEARAPRADEEGYLFDSPRCRFEPEDFRADYQAFSARHLNTLNAAARELRQALTVRYGRQGAERALDKLSVHMANSYGLGHPTMDCAELRQATRNLAYNTSDEGLAAAADELLAGQAQDSVFLASRY